MIPDRFFLPDRANSPKGNISESKVNHKRSGSRRSRRSGAKPVRNENI